MDPNRRHYLMINQSSLERKLLFGCYSLVLLFNFILGPGRKCKRLCLARDMCANHQSSEAQLVNPILTLHM